MDSSNDGKKSAKEAHEIEQQEKEKQRRIKKDRKKREKKEKQRRNKELLSLIDLGSTIVERIEKIDDMNLKCYMLLDKIMFLMDAGLFDLTLKDEISEDTREIVNYQIGNMKNIITDVMEWVMSERKVPVVELDNPIPENDRIRRN